MNLDEMITEEETGLIALEEAAKKQFLDAQQRIEDMANRLEKEKVGLAEIVSQTNQALSWKRGRVQMLKELKKANENGVTPGTEEETQPDAG